MDNILTLDGPDEMKKRVAEAFKGLRLSKELTRQSLARMSGVKEPSLKRFESTGDVSFVSLLKIADGLGILSSIESVIEAARPPLKPSDLRRLSEKKSRKRGTR